MGEAPLHAAEAGKALADRLVGNAELVSDGDRAGRVLDIVLAGHRQREADDVADSAAGPVTDRDAEARHRALGAQVAVAHVGLGIGAIGDDAAVLDAPDEFLHLGMIEAHDGKAIERDVLDELLVGLPNLPERAIVVEMLGIDIGDHGDVGRQLQEGAVRFVGLDHHPLTSTHARIRAVGIDDAAIDDGGVEPARFQERRDERGRRGLAMRAADGDGATEPHQFGEHFSTTHHRQQLFARRDQFRIALLDGGGNDDDFGIAEVFSLVSDMDRNALVAQPLHIGTFRLVGTLHAMTEVVQNLGDAAHPDTAYTDKMH